MKQPPTPGDIIRALEPFGSPGEVLPIVMLVMAQVARSNGASAHEFAARVLAFCSEVWETEFDPHAVALELVRLLARQPLSFKKAPPS